MDVWKMSLLVKAVIFRFHLLLPGLYLELSIVRNTYGVRTVVISMIHFSKLGTPEPQAQTVGKLFTLVTNQQIFQGSSSYNSQLRLYPR